MSQFYKLPQDLTARTDLPASAKIIYAVIVDRIGENGSAWPGVRWLARKCGAKNYKTVAEAVAKLEAARLLLVERRKKGQSNLYRLPESVPKNGTLPETDRGDKRTEKRTRGVPKNGTQAYRKTATIQTDLLIQTGAAAPPAPFANSGDEDGVPYTLIGETWNKSVAPTTCSSLRDPRHLSTQRKRHLDARWKQVGFRQNWQALFEAVAKTPFLCGRSRRGWRADFDWIIGNDGNWQKVLEGKYADTAPGANCVSTPGDGYDAQAIENGRQLAAMEGQAGA